MLSRNRLKKIIFWVSVLSAQLVSSNIYHRIILTILVFIFLGINLKKTSLKPLSKNIQIPKYKFKKNKNSLITSILIIIVLIGIALRVYGIKKIPIWYDEATSISITQNPHKIKYSRASVYHTYLNLIIGNSNKFWLGRIANIPFFIISAIFIYFFGKKLHSKLAGILGTFFYSMSWITITMNRDLRFYEMFLCFFIIANFLLYNALSNYLSKKRLILKNKFFISNLLLSFLFFLLSMNTHTLTFLILYPLILFGGIIFIKLKNLKGLLIANTALIFIYTGFIYKGFTFYNIFNFSLPSWFNYKYNAAPFFNFSKELISNDHSYILITLPTLIVLIFKKKTYYKFQAIFLLSFIIGLYSILSVNGIGYIELIRYYYMLLPFIFIGTGFSIATIYQNFIKKQQKLITISFILFIVTWPLYTGIKESISPQELNSKYIHRNLPYTKIIEIMENPKYSDYIFVSDQLFAWSEYTYKEGNTKITYIIDRHSNNYNTGKYHDRSNIKVVPISYLIRKIKAGEKVIFIDDERYLEDFRMYIKMIPPDETLYNKKLYFKEKKISIKKYN